MNCKSDNANSSSETPDAKLQLKFLDEYILPGNLLIKNTIVGGLSGIDYKDNYYLVCDDSKVPRFYKMNITINSNKISDVTIEDVTLINTTNQYFDLESILFEDSNILFTSEGLIQEGKDPLFFSVGLNGENLSQFQLPTYFKATSPQKPRNNGVFEGLARSFDKKGYWIITELPLEADGDEPTPLEANSPVRLTYFDKESRVVKKQFVYQLDKIAKAPLGDFAVNGVTDLLAYASNKLLVIERSFSSGHGNRSNDIKIYNVAISNATNSLDILSLKNTNYTPVTKKLLFNFESVRNQLTNGIIDNIEGVCFGPKLSNGNQTVILVSDNNFNETTQLNQFILMELIVD